MTRGHTHASLVSGSSRAVRLAQQVSRTFPEAHKGEGWETKDHSCPASSASGASTVAAQKAKMANVKLFYFDSAGRAELIRLVLTAAKVEFDDVRFQGDDWPAKYKPGEKCWWL